jgi:hypothetical protein
VFALGVVLPALEAAEYCGRIPPGTFSALALLLLSVKGLVYKTYAPEPTSLQVRLTAVSLIVVMAVLTLAAGIVAESTERSARASRSEKAEQVLSTAERGALAPADLHPAPAARERPLRRASSRDPRKGAPTHGRCECPHHPHRR